MDAILYNKIDTEAQRIIAAINAGGSIPSVVINTNASTTQGCYDAVATAIGITGNENWFAWVNDANYMTDNNDAAVMIIGCANTNSRSIYRSDSGTLHNNFRRFNPGVSDCTIPANTTFYYVILPA